MLGFKKLNEINGFDENDLNNGKQNNYAWSMAEFNDFIYVGTGRNITLYSVNILSIGAKAPLLSPSLYPFSYTVSASSADGSFSYPSSQDILVSVFNSFSNDIFIIIKYVISNF